MSSGDAAAADTADAKSIETTKIWRETDTDPAFPLDLTPLITVRGSVWITLPAAILVVGMPCQFRCPRNSIQLSQLKRKLAAWFLACGGIDCARGASWFDPP